MLSRVYPTLAVRLRTDQTISSSSYRGAFHFGALAPTLLSSVFLPLFDSRWTLFFHPRLYNCQIPWQWFGPVALELLRILAADCLYLSIFKPW